ncbi:MAG: hypothetical protein K2P60_02110, partial [Lachnospiraceae bacterium]|nr:hypothetical protein [Lachnospiraceae bacterium]
MAKLFFDVFPTLAVHEEMRALLSEMEITKVSANPAKTWIRIYLSGSRLIHKSNIFALEKQIKKQLFPRQNMEIKIIEKFHLSKQYTARKLMDIYKDSMEQEIKEYSLLLYNMYHSAKTEFPEENRMELCLEDTIIAREKSEELVQILEKIVCERCGLDFKIDLCFSEAKKGSRIKNADFAIHQEVKHVLERAM